MTDSLQVGVRTTGYPWQDTMMAIVTAVVLVALVVFIGIALWKYFLED